MRIKLYSAFRTTSTLALSLSLASTAHAQPAPEEEVPIEEGELEEETGEEVSPVEEGPPAPQPVPEQAPPAQPPAEVPIEEDEFFGEGGEDPARPAPKGKGVIWGVVTDSEGQPVLEGPVNVVGTKTQIITDFDGRYRLELPPGNYSVRFFYEFHQPLRIDVSVSEGEVKQVDAELKADEEAPVEEFEVVAKLEEASLESQILKRQQSAAVADGVGRQEMGRTPDSNAAAAAQRVVGTNIVDGRFVYVRGLGERYSNSLLFGAPLPSPEPDKAAVPLDLFPALVLDSVNIAKTFTPDMPGDFAGGSVQIETRGVPEEFVFNASVSGAYVTGTTFHDRLDYAGSSTDWLAVDDGAREMPDVPNFNLKSGSRKPDRSLVRSDELIEPGRDLNTPIHARRKATPLDHGASVVVGNGWLLPGDQKLGVLASLNYKREYRIIEGILKEYQRADNDRGFDVGLNYDKEEGSIDVSWGAFASVAYQPSSKHEVRLMGLHSQSATDATRYWQGFDIYTRTTVAATQLDWVQRGLTLGQLSGRHTFDALNAGELGWDVALARATRFQPDRRDVVFDRIPEQNAWRYRDGSENGRHFYADQYENSINAKLDYTQPIVDALKVKIGGLSALKDRHFEARRFAFRRNPRADIAPCPGLAYSFDCPDPILVDENIDDLIQLEEGTEKEDFYDARLNVYAGYLMGDVEVTQPLRAVFGMRVEHTDQAVEPVSRFGEEVTIKGAELEQTDYLPAVGLTFSATEKVKARFSYSRTLARPQLRELAPFRFSSYFGGRSVSGYPDLDLTRIDNYDSRFEYFPTLREVLAFSFFVKDFTDPIEPIVISSGSNGTTSFRNAPGAKLIGVELEARKDLGVLTPALNDFQIVTNLTLTHSRTEVPEGGEFLTNQSRPLVNQAPWVFNVAIDYEGTFGLRARALYNVSGKRLIEVGTDGLPDAYEHPAHSLDLVLAQTFAEHWQLKAQAQNILNAERLVTQGKQELPDDASTIERYKEGVTLGLGLSYTH